MTDTSFPDNPLEHDREIRQIRNKRPEQFSENPELQNSMLYWLPPLEDAVSTIPSIEIPETLFVNLEPINAYKLASESDEEITDAEMDALMQCPAEWDTTQVTRAVEHIGTPAFLRTDTDSDKHNIENAGYITSTEPDHVNDTVDALIRGAAKNSGMMGAPRFNFLAVREHIDIHDSFTAFDGTPIGPEVRVFVRDGDVECHHFYWPFHEDRMVDSVDGNYDLDKQLAVEEMQITIGLAMDEHLRDAAAEISTHFEGYWSIDFAHTTNGDWYVIDMARGDDSWHPNTCDNVETEPEPQDSVLDDIEELGFDVDNPDT